MDQLLVLIVVVLATGVVRASYLSERFGVLTSPKIFSRNVLGYLSNETSLRHRCRVELAQFATDLQDGRQWALNMYDANGKLPSGVLDGNLAELGSFDECLRIARTNDHGLTGKYCLASLYVPSLYVDNATLRLLHDGLEMNKMEFAVCYPSSCSATDLEKVTKGIGLNLTITESTCQTKATQYSLTAGSYVTLALACVILALIVASTIYEICLKGKSHWALKSFSLWSNGKLIFSIKKPGPNEIQSLSGIRTLAMTAVILVHVTNDRFEHLTRNTYYYSYWIHQAENGPIIRLSIVADVFLLISGCLVSYNFLQRKSKGAEVNIASYYVERYLRLTPSLVAMLLFTITWYGYIGSGPLWYQSKDFIRPCKTNWWSYLLYIQNYVIYSVEKAQTFGELLQYQCIGTTWYLSIDFQLYVLSPILLIPLARWRRETMAVTAGLTLLSIATTFTLAWKLKMCASNDCRNEDVYLKYYYYFVPTKASSWLIGFLLGSLMFNVKAEKTSIIKKNVAIPLMLAGIILYVGCLFGENRVVVSSYDRFENSFALALLRPANLLAVGCVIYVCEIGHGGIVTSFLSNPLFVVISRLTFAMYLVHLHVVHFSVNTGRVTPYVSGYTLLVNEFSGALLLSLLYGLVLSLSVELPAQHFVRYLMNASRMKKR
ncbi:hypothetical protein PPYR_15382 [Photinus pyralis]|uniref:Nose resistant-to-fluoxetine protein N-terminal domain-containing protein n=2 Tax=Photinus pyralis TaxID=7054 RepID=A0A5N3ZYY3_PHOPY|nr:hypothetical protein PPYR_15382 [Photinus pyralis]